MSITLAELENLIGTLEDIADGLEAVMAPDSLVAAALDDARVVARGEAFGTGALGEREQLGEAEAAVAADARVRRLPTLVPPNKRVDDCAPKLLAQVERHMRHPERVAGRTGSQHRIRRTACALGVRPIRIAMSCAVLPSPTHCSTSRCRAVSCRAPL